MRFKKLLIFILVFGFVFSIAGLLYAARQPRAMVTGIYGTLTVFRDKQKKSAKIRMPLYKDDKLSTSKKSKAVLLLKDGSEVKMGPSTKMTIQGEKEKKGLLVTLGKIYANLKPRKSNSEILTPYGAAAIEGTQLQVEVGEENSEVSVAEGKVRFYNNKSKVMLAQNSQSSSNSMDDAIPRANKVNAIKLMRWQRDIQKYYDAIEAFMNKFDQIKAIKAGSVGGSLYQAQQQIDELKQIEKTLQQIVPDAPMRNGHMKLISALDYYKKSLIFTDPAQSAAFEQKADANFNIARADLIKWKADYEKAERKFLEQ